MRYLPRKAADMIWNQSKREKCVAVNEAERSWRSEEPFDISHGDAEFWGLSCWVSVFGPIFPHYATFPPFWNDNIYSVPLYVGNI